MSRLEELKKNWDDFQKDPDKNPFYCYFDAKDIGDLIEIIDKILPFYDKILAAQDTIEAQNLIMGDPKIFFGDK